MNTNKIYNMKDKKMKVRITSKQIIQLKQKGINQKDMATIFGISPQTIVRWKKQKKPAPWERKRKPKDYGDIPKLLKFYVSKNNVATQQEMADYVSEEKGKPISQQTITRILKSERI